MMTKKIIGISGSLRKESYSTKLLKAFQQRAPEGHELEILDISRLPMFNEDLEVPELQEVTEFKNSIKAADAVLLATPEYNRSFSPAIKNALDWGSRSIVKTEDQVWKGKPVGVLGSSPYKTGAMGAVLHLRQVLVFIDLIPLQQPEFYLNFVAEKFDDKGNLIDESTKEHIELFWAAFAVHLHKVMSVQPRSE